MKKEEVNIEKEIRKSGLKNPSKDFIVNTMNQLPDNWFLIESKKEVFFHKFSWFFPTSLILAGLIFVFTVIPTPELTYPSITSIFDFEDFAKLFIKLFNNIYILAGLVFVMLFILCEIIVDRLRNIPFVF